MSTILFQRVGAAMALLALALSAASAVELQNSRPNIVVVLTDDQGYGPIGRHGNPWIRTPNLDRLHDASVRFTRFQVSPTCSPTRAALLTGRHPMRNGITHTILERERLTLDAVTLPQVLREAGYTTGMFGKWHLGDEDPYQPHNRGFDETFIHGAGGIGQAYDCSCADVPDNSYFDPVIRHNGSFVKTEGFCTDVFFAAALGWISQVKDEETPFFAWIASNAPHSPYTAPEKNARRFTDLGFDDKHAGFYGMIENIDENIGRMIEKLESWDLLRETLLVFLSDNGSAGDGLGQGVLGQSQDGTSLLAWNAGMKGYKVSVDEGGTRVPAYFRWDGRIAANKDSNRLTAHIDLFPTLAALAGASLPDGQIEGRSLLPLLTDPEAAWPDRYLFVHQGRWPLGANPDDFQWKNFSVRSQRFRFVNNSELFDMEVDPEQTRNVIDEHAEVVAAMRGAYEQWWKETRPMMVNEGVPMSPVRPFHQHYGRQLAERGIPQWFPPVE